MRKYRKRLEEELRGKMVAHFDPAKVNPNILLAEEEEVEERMWRVSPTEQATILPDEFPSWMFVDSFLYYEGKLVRKGTLRKDSKRRVIVKHNLQLSKDGTFAFELTEQSF